MAKIEYRLYEAEKQFPSLHLYTVSPMELSCRMNCEYFTKEKKHYRAVLNAHEPYGLSVVYLIDEEEEKDEPFADEKTYEKITLEIREFKDRNDAPIIHLFENMTYEKILRKLQSDLIYLPKDNEMGIFDEYCLICTELDEDRNCYIYYAEKTEGVLDYTK